MDTVTVVFGWNTAGTGRYAGWPLDEYRNDEGTGLSCQLRSELPSAISKAKSRTSGRGVFGKLKVESARMYSSSAEGGTHRPPKGACVSGPAACTTTAPKRRS